MAGNFNKGGTDPFFSFAVTGSTTDLLNASNSVWTAVAYCNSVIENVVVKAGPKCTPEVKNAVIGEAMVWKSMAYFYLVRMFHDVPIIHSNSKLINDGTASFIMKNPATDITSISSAPLPKQPICFLLRDFPDVLTSGLLTDYFRKCILPVQV
ncbi:MAG: RagB/SusD family nutrient uptake outer membrane protein [Bacteroidales bacterium]|nr:RagB/SusD family nutrient uptake outer membrane protein [Bacteroidales bacterium]